MPDGKQGPPLELRALFQQFFDEVSRDQPKSVYA
jgi:hypothetical protein